MFSWRLLAEGQRDESVNGVNHMAAHCGCFVCCSCGLWLWVCGLCRVALRVAWRVAGRGIVGIKKVIFEIAC
jgi:hypothetical protein